MRARRDNIVSIRLNDEEREYLATLGRPSDVLRDLLLGTRTARQKAADLMEWMLRPSVIWSDGTVGQTWPAVTR